MKAMREGEREREDREREDGERRNLAGKLRSVTETCGSQRVGERVRPSETSEERQSGSGKEQSGFRKKKEVLSENPTSEKLSVFLLRTSPSSHTYRVELALLIASREGEKRSKQIKMSESPRE